MSGLSVAGVLSPIGEIQPASFLLAKRLANCIPLSTSDYKGGVTLHASPVRLVGKVDFQFGSEGIAGGLASWEFRIRRMTHWVFLALLRPAFILAARVLPSPPIWTSHARRPFPDQRKRMRSLTASMTPVADNSVVVPDRELEE